jgi:hypothetical protein
VNNVAVGRDRRATGVIVAGRNAAKASEADRQEKDGVILIGASSRANGAKRRHRFRKSI